MRKRILKSSMLARRGSAYVLVIGAAMLTATIAMGALLAGRTQARAVNLNDDSSVVMLAAQSGIDLARLWIAQDTNWRSNRTSGTWAQSVSIGGASVTIEVVDTVDGILANRPHDAVRVTSTATKGTSRHAVTLMLQAQPTPLPVLAYPLAASGPVRVRQWRTLTLGDQTLFTSSSLRNEGTIEGNAEVNSFTTIGTIFGTRTSGAAAKQTPASTVAESYASLGTLIATPSTVDRIVLGPGINPYGTANAEGVYVIRASANITLRYSRIYGTLVIIAPGKKVTLLGSIFMQPTRPDYPALIVDGDVDIIVNSDVALSESAQGTNFNPVGAPYQALTDSDLLDSYPSEIQGLVHVTGIVQSYGKFSVRGAFIAGSTSTGVDLDSSGTIDYDPNLFLSPPQFYTTRVLMVPQSSSWKRQVD